MHASAYGFLLRLALDFLAAGLLLAGLAYYWLDNLAHELIGSAMFVLLVVHAVFNRRWYGAIARGRYDTRRLIGTAINLPFLAVMLVLLVTSVMISRSLFGFLPLQGGFTAREIHMLAAYWAVAVVGVHLGLHWSMVMNAIRNALGIASRSAVRALVTRLIAAAVAAHGVQSSFEMAFGSKLLLHYTLDMWDFNAETPRFFLDYMSIVGLYAFLAHYAVTWLQRRKRTATPRAAFADRPFVAGGDPRRQERTEEPGGASRIKHLAANRLAEVRARRRREHLR